MANINETLILFYFFNYIYFYCTRTLQIYKIGTGCIKHHNKQVPSHIAKSILGTINYRYQPSIYIAT